jgi:hypothetical protein
MAGPAPKTREWRAVENAHKPQGLHVLVYGEVQVSATNMEPRLTEEPERNPKNLGFKLTIQPSPDEGVDVMVWRSVHFHKEVEADQYDHVIVRWEGEQIADIPVRDDRECADEAAAAMKALNERHAARAASAKPARSGKPAPPARSAAKSPAPKTPAAKKPPAKKTLAKKAPAKKAPVRQAPATKKAAAKQQPRAVGGWAKSKKAKKSAAKKTAKKPSKKSTKKAVAKKKTAAKKKRR